MNTQRFSYKLGLSILIANFCFFVFIVICKINDSLISDEFEKMLQLLVPIKSLYISLIIKFMSEHKSKQPTKTQYLSSGYVYSIVFIVASYLISLFVLVFLKIIQALTFQAMINLIVFVETVFGGYAGYMINNLFKYKEK